MALHVSPWRSRLLVALLLAVMPAGQGRAGVPDGPERLRRSAEMGELENVKKLILKEKVDVNSAPMFGETPLHWSSQSGHLEVVEELISLGGDVSCVTCCSHMQSSLWFKTVASQRLCFADSLPDGSPRLCR